MLVKVLDGTFTARAFSVIRDRNLRVSLILLLIKVA
jgi:hypothetical protein